MSQFTDDDDDVDCEDDHDGDEKIATTTAEDVRMTSTDGRTTPSSLHPSSSSFAPAPLLSDQADTDESAAADDAGGASLPNIRAAVTDLYYRSDYRVEHIGKHVKSTKRRVTWTFYRRAEETTTKSAPLATLAAAQEKGEGGEDEVSKSINNIRFNTAHKGHADIPIEVCLEWSLRSGKQRITVNGIVEYYTQRKNASLVEHQWELLPISPPQNDTTTTPPPPPPAPPSRVVLDTATSTTTTTTASTDHSSTVGVAGNMTLSPFSSSSSNNDNNSSKNLNQLHQKEEPAPAPAPAAAQPWLILHVVAARVRPNSAEFSSFVLEELLLDNVRFGQLPNQAGDFVTPRPPAKLYELSTCSSSLTKTNNSNSNDNNKNKNSSSNNAATSTSSTSTPLRRPTSILDILYPAGVTGPTLWSSSTSFDDAPPPMSAAAPPPQKKYTS
jgi:hypothetical protein